MRPKTGVESGLRYLRLLHARSLDVWNGVEALRRVFALRHANHHQADRFVLLCLASLRSGNYGSVHAALHHLKFCLPSSQPTAK